MFRRYRARMNTFFSLRQTRGARRKVSKGKDTIERERYPSEMSPRGKKIFLCEMQMLSLSSIQCQSTEQEVLLGSIWEEQRFILLRTVADLRIRLVTCVFSSDIPDRRDADDEVQSVRGSLFADGRWRLRAGKDIIQLSRIDVIEFSTPVLHLVCTGMISITHGRITSQSDSSAAFSLATAARIIVD